MSGPRGCTVGQFVWALCTFCLLSVSPLRAEVFSALVDMKRVLLVEHEIAHELKDYIGRELERLNRLARIADDYERHSQEGLKDPEKHLGNPINAFLLVKRFTTDWNQIVERDIRTTTTLDFMERISSKTADFPESQDLQGAAAALMRLQDTYDLDTGTIVKGALAGVEAPTAMTVDDCYQLGLVAYEKSDHYHAALWMHEALRLLDDKGTSGVSRALILDYLAFSVYMQGNTRLAYNMTVELLSLDPDNIRAQNNKFYYEQYLTSGQKNPDVDNVDESQEYTEKSPDIQFTAAGVPARSSSVYERLCRGEQTQVNPDESRLTCQYRRHHPSLYLNPLKEEVMYLSPRILIYHDMLTNTQIERIKALALPRLERSVVFHSSNEAKTTVQDYRVSKSAWLKDVDDPMIERVSNKARVIANLSLETAEEMQVLNYGIGGHYEPHFDFASSRDTAFETVQGNRIATGIYYLTDVTAGGATVFPDLGVRLWPEKGACAMWYNIMRSGDGDFRTRHAACPVLTGIKWVCNKWFHERGQEFIRPCALSPTE